MGKYNDKEITLNNGDKVLIEVNKSLEDGHLYYTHKSVAYAFDEVKKVEDYLNKKNSSSNPQLESDEINDQIEEREDSSHEIDYSLSEDNNSLDDDTYDFNGNNTNGHYDDDGDYWAPGSSELDCS